MFNTKIDKQILDMFDSHDIDISKLDILLDKVDINKCDYEESYRWSLLSECIYYIANQPINIDLLDIVKLFVKKGLNLDIFGNTLIGDLDYAITKDDNMIRVAEYILNNKSYIGDIYPIIDKLNINNKICSNILDEQLLNSLNELYSYILDYLKNIEKLTDKTWKPLIIKDYKKLLNKLNSFNIKNKKITSIRAIGMVYNFNKDEIEAKAYNILRDDKLSDFNNIPPNTLFNRYIEVDEPIVITFDDNTHLEIEYTNPNCIKISKNKINKFHVYNTNIPNIDLNILFSNCLGEKIEDIVIELTTDKNYFNIPIAKQDIYIKNIIFKLSNFKQIVFRVFFDYGIVSIKNYNENSKILFKDLKKSMLNNI